MILSVLSCSGPEKAVKLNELDISKMSCGWKTARADSSVAGGPLSVGGTRFEKGIGTHAVSTFLIRLDKKGKILQALPV